MIYYWEKEGDTGYMLFVYPKNAQEDLSQRRHGRWVGSWGRSSSDEK